MENSPLKYIKNNPDNRPLFFFVFWQTLLLLMSGGHDRDPEMGKESGVLAMNLVLQIRSCSRVCFPVNQFVWR